MSYVLTNAVWNSDLKCELRLLALTLADIGNDDGYSIYLSVARMAWRTKSSERQIQRDLRELETLEILEQVAPARQHYPATYRFHMEKLPTRSGFETVPGVTVCHPSAPGVTSATPGVTPMSPYLSMTHQGSTDLAVDLLGIHKAEQTHRDSAVVSLATTASLCDVDSSMSRARAPAREKPSDAAARAAFEKIWAVHPRKVGKEHAWRAWRRIWVADIWVRGTINREKLGRIVRALERAIPLWRDRVLEGDASFVPHLASWLNGKRWEDEDDDDTTDAAQAESLLRDMYPPVKDL